MLYLSSLKSLSSHSMIETMDTFLPENSAKVKICFCIMGSLVITTCICEVTTDSKVHIVILETISTTIEISFKRSFQLDITRPHYVWFTTVWLHRYSMCVRHWLAFILLVLKMYYASWRESHNHKLLSRWNLFIHHSARMYTDSQITFLNLQIMYVYEEDDIKQS